MAQAAADLSSLERLLTEVMNLPEAARAQVALELLHSLPHSSTDSGADSWEDPLASDSALTVELQRRRTAYLDGNASWVSLDEFEAELERNSAAAEEG